MLSSGYTIKKVELFVFIQKIPKTNKYHKVGARAPREKVMLNKE